MSSGTLDLRSSEELFSRKQLNLSSQIEIDGKSVSILDIINRLEQHLTPERIATIRSVVAQRSFRFVTVMENIYDRGNVSAVMRSMDAFGFPRVHLIDPPGGKFRAANRVSKGTEKWLDICLETDATETVTKLRRQGYQIFATELATSTELQSLNFSKKTAIVLGNEKVGVSKSMLEQVDGTVRIPMFGFAQSFNISVAAALILYHARMQQDPSQKLEPELFDQILANYYLRCLDNPGIYFG